MIISVPKSPTVLKKIFEICVEDASGVLKETPAYEEVARVCSRLKPGVLESINHLLERGNKRFAFFPDVRKAFDTVLIDGLLYKIFLELGIKKEDVAGYQRPLY